MTADDVFQNANSLYWNSVAAPQTIQHFWEHCTLVHIQASNSTVILMQLMHATGVS